MSQDLEAEIARLEASKKKNEGIKCAKITTEDIRKAVANGGELILPPDFVDKHVKFGKHKGKTYNWVYQNDPRWMQWAFLNVPGFEGMAKAANYKQP